MLELRDTNGVVVLAVVLEVQRDKDPDKEYSWPVYVTVVRAKKRGPTVVLVVAPDAEVAAWAAQPIDLGLGFGTLRPVVLGPASVPEVTDPAVAERETELAVLSAVAHGNGPNGLAVVQAALVALARLDREHAAVYFQIIVGIALTEDEVARVKACDDPAQLDRWIDNVLGAKTAGDVLS